VPRPERLDNGGLGRLLSAVIDWARGQEMELLHVWPSDPSRSFYERAGFIASPESMELIFERPLSQDA